ncbi:MAG: T9SS type A sorting domain-containing protein [Crocinitomix sp.]|nr:T9SS type A sorting domain-containing protein [Crocinitomix sp.]
MKRIFTYLGILTLTASISFAQDQLDNGSFENWDDVVIKDSLDNWFTTTSSYFPFESNVTSTDGVTGNAVHLETVLTPEGDEVASAGIILASELGEAFPIGYTYDSDVDNLNAHLRYNIAVGDTGFVLVILELDGAPFAFAQFPIFGEQDEWDLFSWEIEGAVITPDAVTIAFFSSGFDDSEGIEGSWLEVDNVFFGNDGPSPAALPNFSFEDWSPVELEVAEDWYTLDPVLYSILGFNNITRSTDATDGAYSMKIEVFDENIDEEIIPFISNGEFDFEEENFIGGSEFTSAPILFKGDFKFLSDATDEANIFMRFWNDAGDFIEYEETLSPGDDWEEFSIAIDLDFTPDSVLTVLFSGAIADGVMFYDNLRFVYDDVSVNKNTKFNIQSYPNPANNYIHIGIDAVADLVITNLLGQTVYSQTGLNKSVAINTSDWPNGVYLVQVYKEAHFETQRIVVQH